MIVFSQGDPWVTGTGRRPLGAAEAALVDDVAQGPGGREEHCAGGREVPGLPSIRAPTAVRVTGGSSTPLRSRIAIAAVVLTPSTLLPSFLDRNTLLGGCAAWVISFVVNKQGLRP